MKSQQEVNVVRLWQLPDDFFLLPMEQQWSAMKAITSKASPQPNRRSPCRIKLADDILAVAFFLVTLGTPIAIAAITAISVLLRSKQMFVGTVVAALLLALHPMGRKDWRRTRLSLALARYFSMEVIIDRSNPLLRDVATPAIDDQGNGTKKSSGGSVNDHDERIGLPLGGSVNDHDERIGLPLVCLACPHGVFNYGAIIWCAFSRWFVGYEQKTAAASVVRFVPGLRYMDKLILVEDAGKTSIQKVLRKRRIITDRDTTIGGMLGIVPDGIAGAFRCKGGIDELSIGKRRGLMRLCIEEGATVLAAWFFGTTDMLTVVQDPFGLMETASRKLQAGMMFFYGRWGLPVPRRIPVSLCVSPHKCKKMENPSKEEVETVHTLIYGDLCRTYDEQKIFAGYGDRNLHVS